MCVCVKNYYVRVTWNTDPLLLLKRTEVGNIQLHVFHLPQEIPNEPAYEIMALFVLRKCFLRTGMHSHSVGLDVWFLVRHFVYFHTSCERTAKALARLRRCWGSPEPSLVAYVISTIISWAGSNLHFLCYLHQTWQKGSNALTIKFLDIKSRSCWGSEQKPMANSLPLWWNTTTNKFTLWQHDIADECH